MSTNIAFVLTHKRRGAIALFKGCGHLCERVNALVESGEASYGTPLQNAVLLLSHADTAESLADLYEKGLGALNLSEMEMDALVLGVGPGSFTGLRLGCSFANGLLFGRKRKAWALSSAFGDDWNAFVQTQQAQEGCFEAWKSPPPKDEDDPFSAPVSAADMAGLVWCFVVGQAVEVEEFQPCYGREPGPVLKLRSSTDPV
jgi:hypothetical protein